jgi:demethylmenaquinone methyltransferase/2-methoxy-6-polyprenyl-1,4-benzoquinol methylase
VADVARPAAVKGTQPEGARTEADASRKVREMFTEIAPSYDLLNHLLSLQLDRLWRGRAVNCLRPLLEGNVPLVLDLCCGTGDLAMAMARRFTPRVIGADFALPMLMRAKEKSATLRGKNLVQLRRPKFVEADALRLPFADQCFDLVTSAFGFRNLANYEAGLREIQRVLRPGGTIAILEFTEPPDSLLGDVYRWYFSKVLPRIGGFISGHSAAYTYLPKSVARFLRPPELAALMVSLAYESIEYKVWTFGTVALHTGIRPPR